MAGQAIPTDEQLAQQMKIAGSGSTASVQFRPYSLCQKSCAATAGSCHSARRLAEDANIWQVFCRLIQSTINDASAMERLWGELETGVQNQTAFSVISWTCLLTHLSHRFVMRRGAQAGWSYTKAQIFMEQLHKVLLIKQTGQTSLPELSLLQRQALVLYRTNFQPCAACQRVHGVDESGKAEPLVCLYRMAVDDLVAAGRFNASFTAAEQVDLASEDKQRRRTWEICQDAGYELIEFGEDAPDGQRKQIAERAERCCLCFGQQMLAQNSRKPPRIVFEIVNRLLSETKGKF